MFCYRACLKSCLPSLHKIYTHSLQQLETCKQDSVWRTSRVKLWHRPHHWELHVTGQAGHLSKLAHTLSAETFLARLIFSQRKLLNIQYIYMNSAKTGQTILQSQSLIFGLSLSRNVRNSAGCGGGESRRGPANCLFCQLFWVIGNNETRVLVSRHSGVAANFSCPKCQSEYFNKSVSIHCPPERVSTFLCAIKLFNISYLNRQSQC